MKKLLEITDQFHKKAVRQIDPELDEQDKIIGNQERMARMSIALRRIKLMASDELTNEELSEPMRNVLMDILVQAAEALK